MGGYKRGFKNIMLISLCLCLVMKISIQVKAQSMKKERQDTPTLILTQAEKEYIEQTSVLTVIGMDRMAPLIYTGENGEVRGISKRVLDEIADMTGLIFEYELVDSLDKILKQFKNKEADIVGSIPYNYAIYSFPNMILSQPHIKSSTVLFLQSSLSAQDLDNKIYSAVKGSALPEGIKKENTIYFDTREESLDAVNSGQADYGHGNAYSVAFYTLQNGYKNIKTIPTAKESREYCMGFINEDELLISIISKSLESIDERTMQNLILDVTSHINRKITPSMILDAYEKEIIAITFAVIAILIYGTISKAKANTRLEMQNRRYEVLSEISNEYLYEYNIKKNQLLLSERCIQLFGTQERVDDASGILKKSFSNLQLENHLKLPLANGEMGVFRGINSSVYDSSGKIEFIIGKLIDISEEIAEKEALVLRAQVDGPTGLYNSTTSRELITERINCKGSNIMDALVLLDIDLFKNINDNLGHYQGDLVLQDLAKDLKSTFANTDIIGRFGGDEFCVYMKDIPSVEFVRMKCKELNDVGNKRIEGVEISVSIGVALVNEIQPYERLFKMADYALYQAKHNGRGQFVIFDEPMEYQSEWNKT